MAGHGWMQAPTQRLWPRALAAAQGRVWLHAAHLTHGESGSLVALDAATGAGLWSAPLAHNRLAYNTCFVGDGWVAATEGLPGELSKQRAVGFDAETGARLWAREAELIAGAGRHAFLRGPSDELTVLDGRSGAVVGQIALTAGWRNLGFWSPNLLLRDGELWYLGKQALVRAADRGGWRVVERIETGDTFGAALVDVGGRLMILKDGDTREGAGVALLALADGSFSKVGRLEGRLRAAAGGDFLSVWTAINEKTDRFTALVPGGPSDSLLSVAPNHASPITLGGGAALTAPYRYVIIARLRDGVPVLTRVSLPEQHWTSAVIGDGVAWVQSADRLMRLELAALPLEPAPDLALPWLDPPGPSHAPDFYARVTGVGEGEATAEHPDLGVVTLRGDVSGLKPRARVTLEEVREVLPGVYRVRRWRPAHGTAALYTPPAALSLPASDLPPLPAAPASTETAWAAALRGVAAARGFAVSPLMARFFERCDTDERFRQQVQRLGLYLSIDGTTGCWLGTDSAIVRFAGDMSGQVYGLYLYPPEQLPDAPAPIVYWDHETREVSWQAADFDTFLRELLADRERWHKDENAVFVRDALGLSAGRPERVPAPVWFVDAHSEPSVGLQAALELAE